MKSVTKFYAIDGTEFATAFEVYDYELDCRLRDEFGWDQNIRASVILNAGRLRYLLGEYLKQFPEK